MTYQFEDPIACTEALVTAVEERNDFGQYTLTILGIDQNGCYTNRGTVTINEEELQPLLRNCGRNRRRQHFSRRLQKTAKKSTWNFERGYFYEADFRTYL